MIIQYFSRLLFLACFFLMAPGFAYSQGVSNAALSPSETFISTPTSLIFTADVSAGITAANALVKDSVLLYETTVAGKLLTLAGKMYDDGSHGDAIANDGRYTVRMLINETTPLTRYYKVSAAYSGVRNRYLSEIIDFKVFPPLPPEIVSDVLLTIQAIKKNYYANLAFLGIAGAQSKALDDAIAHLNIGPGNARINGTDLSVSYVYIDPATSFEFKLGGIISLADPSIPSAGSGLSSPISIPHDVKTPDNDNLLIYAPFYRDFSLGVESAASIFSYGNFMSFNPHPTVIMKDENASLELMKKFGDYGTIIINTHGGLYSPYVVFPTVVTFSTGTPITIMGLSYPLLLDWITARIVTTERGFWAVTPYFIEKYVGPMKNTFLFLGACHSLENDTMWNVLKDKGAKIAFGFDKTTSIAFAEKITENIVSSMLPISGTANPPNAIQAYNLINPKSDYQPTPTGDSPVIYHPYTTPANFIMKTASSEWEKFEFVNNPPTITLTVTGTKSGYTLPAEITLSNFYKVSAVNFDIFGTQGNTCGSGERGGPIFSQQVDAFADFFGVITVRGVPDQISGPAINLKPCSSFYANKRNAAGLGKVWINATGRARQSNSAATSDWEYQVRYYSGDPATDYSDKTCTLGVVPNSGTYIGSPVTCNVACNNNLFGKLPANSPACN